jgi:hypothetical protein
MIDEETKQIELLKDDIRKLNKKISDVEVSNRLTYYNIRKKRINIEQESLYLRNILKYLKIR